ncbi:MAG TPA: response regulator transcription factor [Dehalococcoidia bacterium]|nr:response regulator transcription factor [Dehalococcoidia bacterium]
MRILLADDHALFRAGLAGLLRAWDMEVVGQASDGLEALEQARKLRPDIILMDVRMPRSNGLEATRLIKTEMPDIRIIMLTVSDDEEDLFEAIKSGAQGYLLKDVPEEEFRQILTSIESGDAPLSRGLAVRILEEFSRLAKEHSVSKAEGDGLTEREHEVLEMVSSGATNREIGAGLYISENTVNYHIKNILSKLHLKNRGQAIAYAIRTGLVNLPPVDKA